MFLINASLSACFAFAVSCSSNALAVSRSQTNTFPGLRDMRFSAAVSCSSLALEQTKFLDPVDVMSTRQVKAKTKRKRPDDDWKLVVTVETVTAKLYREQATLRRFALSLFLFGSRRRNSSSTAAEDRARRRMLASAGS